LYLLIPQYGYLTSDLFLLILVHVHTKVFCLIVPLFPCIGRRVAVHSLYHVFLYTILFPVLGMLI
jgi:hypothetical protein